MLARRQLLRCCGFLAASVVLPPLAIAQARLWRVRLLHAGNDHVPPSYKPLMEGMRALGYEEGRNVVYDFRNVTDEKAAGVAAQAFVRDRVDLIVAFDNEACLAARRATTTLPIVMSMLPTRWRAGSPSAWHARAAT